MNDNNDRPDLANMRFRIAGTDAELSYEEANALLPPGWAPPRLPADGVLTPTLSDAADSRHSRLAELVAKARTEGWYEDDPGWAEVDELLGIHRD